jgi:hypothetical protein
VLSKKALKVICNDIEIASKRGGLGDISIDASLWLGLQERIVEELKRRKTK